MLHLIVRFQMGSNGPIAKQVEDHGAFVFPDKKSTHDFPAKIGVEVLVKIIKTNFQGTARFCKIVGGPDKVAKLRQKRRERAQRIVNRRINAITTILKKDGVSEKSSQVEVEGFIYDVSISYGNYEKRRICGHPVAHGDVNVRGFGLDPIDDHLEKRITVKDVKFVGNLLNVLPNREERVDEIRRSRRPRAEIQVSV